MTERKPVAPVVFIAPGEAPGTAGGRKRSPLPKIDPANPLAARKPDDWTWDEWFAAIAPR